MLPEATRAFCGSAAGSGRMGWVLRIKAKKGVRTGWTEETVCAKAESCFEKLCVAGAEGVGRMGRRGRRASLDLG